MVQGHLCQVRIPAEPGRDLKTERGKTVSNKEKNSERPQLENLQTTNIIATADNPRTINEKGQAFTELLESIKTQGVIVPVHVRLHPKKLGKYELLAGERRLIASIRADKKTIPAINHGGISDEEAFEITFAENFGREDLTPLEQSRAVVILLGKYKNDAQAVASKMGKSVRWVLQRAAISRNLCEEWQKALQNFCLLAQWTPSHLGLVAALPKETQEDLLEDLEYEDWYYEKIPTTAELEQLINNKLRLLSKAPWDLKDSSLITEAMACSKCPNRSSHQPGLFDDTTDKEIVKKNDRCLVEKCWNSKLSAFVELKSKELRAVHKNLVFAVMPDQDFFYNDRRELSDKYGAVFNQWTSSKQGARGALPALIVFGKNAGELYWIKLPKSGTTSSGSKGSKPSKGKPATLKERRELLNKKRWFVVIRKVIENLEEKKVDQLVTDQPTKTVIALTLDFGTSYTGSDLDWKEMSERLDIDTVTSELWENVRDSINNALTYCGPITQTPDNLIKEAQNISALIGTDIDALFKEVSENEYPEPKSWKGLNPDGTTKKEKKAKKQKQKKGN